MSSTFEEGLPDMPQLYTKVVPKNKRRLMVVDGASLALQHRQPQMALAMSIIAAGATIETQLSNLLIPMMGHKAEAAIDHYYSLKTDRQKFSVIKAIAISSLKDEDFALLEAIIKCAQTTQKLRNPIAHWMVAFTPEVEGLVLVNPRANVLHAAKTTPTGMKEYSEMLAIIKRLASDHTIQLFDEYIEKLNKFQERMKDMVDNLDTYYDAIYVYSTRDLTSIEQRIRESVSFLYRFHFYLNWKVQNWHPEITQQKYQELIHEPEIDQVLKSLAQTKEA